MPSVYSNRVPVRPSQVKPVDAAELPRAKCNVDAEKELELTRDIETAKNLGEGLWRWGYQDIQRQDQDRRREAF
jgi:hypothetical protein